MPPSLFPFELMQNLMNSLAAVVPPDVVQIIRRWLTRSRRATGHPDRASQ
jgi:hypothetical protein